MKIEAFELHSVEGKSALDYVAIGEVIVTEGMWWWKKSSTRLIRQEYGGNWHFVDNGKWTPAFQVEALVRVWKAQNGKMYKNTLTG